MAFFGRLEDFGAMFVGEVLERVYAYLCCANNPEHSIHQRILSTKGEVKFELDSDIWAIEQSYALKASSYGFYETHETYVDFQFVADGAEFFALAPKSACTIQKPYNKERDLIIYDTPKHCSKVYLERGMLAVFFPQDVHSGGLGLEELGNKTIHKSVIKIPHKLLTPRWT